MRVAEPFHVARMADDHLLLGLRVGVPDAEVLGAWLAKENLRHIYLAQRWDSTLESSWA